MSATDHPADRLSAYLDDELPPAERTAVEAHLRECGPCGQLLEELSAVDSAARALPLQAPEGYFDAFPARVRARLAGRRARRVPAWTWAVAAAVLLAVLTPLTVLDRKLAPAPAAQEDLSHARTAQGPVAASEAAPPTTILLRSPGAEGGGAAPPAASTRDEPRRQVAGRLDDRLRERDTEGDLGRYGYAAPPARRAAEMKKESAGQDKRAANAAPAPAGAAETLEVQKPDQARAEAPAAPPAPAAAALATPAPTPAAAKPQPADVGLRAGKAAGTAATAEPAEEEAAKTLRADAAVSQPRDEDAFGEEFASIQERPLRTAEEARAAAVAWAEHARRHPQAKTADEARVRAIEAWMTAWRLERRDADREQARALARQYLEGPGPQAARVRARLQALER
jgi:anti-sigma factor RsiW